MYNFVEF